MYKKILISAVLLFAYQSSFSDVLLVHADPGNDVIVQNALIGTGVALGTIDLFNAQAGTPTLAQLSAYDAVFVWTNFVPNDGTALGNVLAAYVDAGGGLLLNTYSFSNPWSVGGDIMNAGYSPLTNLGTNGDPGNILNMVTPDAIFSGVTLANVITFSNGNYAIPGLDGGATLLADNGGGVNMIARNALGNIIGMNIYPGLNVSADAALLYANALLDLSSARVPEPGTLALLGLGLAALGLRRRKQQLI